MPISKQNTNISKNFQTTKPYSTKSITNNNKDTEQTIQTQIKNKPSNSDTPVPNKRTKISDEVSPLTIENIVDSIILTLSPKVNKSSSDYQTPLSQQQVENTNTIIM